MTTTGGFALPTISESSSMKFQQYNDSVDQLDRALTDFLAVSVSGGNATLTLAQVKEHQIIQVSGASASGRTVTLPSGTKRLLVVSLDSGSANNIGVVKGSTTVTVTPGTAAILYVDGTTSGLSAFGFGSVTGPTAYSLAIATASVLGGVKDGTGVTIDGTGVLSVDYGTSAGTAAQGNDTRITGALAASTAATTYAPIASPTFTGTPSAPTGTAGSGGTRLATQAYADTAAGTSYSLPVATASVLGGVKPSTGLVVDGAGVLTADTAVLATLTYVTTQIAAVIDSAPGALDTLNELAAALGDDASFAATITTALALKAPLASPTFTGTPAGPTGTPGAGGTQLATQAYADAAAASGYSLPVATASVLGGVKDGTGITIDGAGVLSIDYGTSAGTAAAGNDSRITGALAASTAATTYAPLASPALTGTPTVPTAAAGTSTTQASSTAFVGAAIVAGAGAAYDVTLFVEGLFTAAETVLRLAVPRAFSIPSGAAGSYGKAGTAATGSFTATLYKNGVSFGTLVWSAAGTTAAVTVGSTTAFAAGDVLSISGAATADATLADTAITLAGTRS